MRYGLFADVHANLPALLRVLEVLEALGVDRHVCAGDVVGYGPHPTECVEAVDALGAAWVSGNHELMVLGRIAAHRASPLARRALAWTQGALAPTARERLARLPATVELPGGIVVAHASLAGPTLRVRAPADVRTELRRLRRHHPGARALVLGHTHAVLVSDGATVARRGVWIRRVRLDPAHAYVVNPGSVGQSRGFGANARAAVLDTESATVELISVRYDTDSLESDLEAAGLPRRSYHRSPLRRIANKVGRRAGRWWRGAGSWART